MAMEASNVVVACTPPEGGCWFNILNTGDKYHPLNLMDPRQSPISMACPSKTAEKLTYFL